MSGADQKVAPRWYSVSVSVGKEAETAAEDAFGILNAGGVETDTLRKEDLPTVNVIGYFESEPRESEVTQALESAFEIHSLDRSLLHQVRIDPVEEQDWLSEWKKHWKPSRAGKFVIAPPWDETVADEKFLIRIEPAMAFGTGTHETTRLCLRLISEYYEPGMSFLDVGTGTGVLSIAAAILYPDESPDILAVDIDKHSVEVAAENAAFNGVSGILFSDGPISGKTAVFEYVCANMTIDIIRPILELLLTKTSKRLLLSGILREQQVTITGDLERLGFVPSRIEDDGEWVAILVEK